LLTAYRRKLIKEDLETVASFEVVEENFDGHARTDKKPGFPPGSRDRGARPALC
jgi:hypothetical protein